MLKDFLKKYFPNVPFKDAYDILIDMIEKSGNISGENVDDIIDALNTQYAASIPYIRIPIEQIDKDQDAIRNSMDNSLSLVFSVTSTREKNYNGKKRIIEETDNYYDMLQICHERILSHRYITDISAHLIDPNTKEVCKCIPFNTTRDIFNNRQYEVIESNDN